MNKHLGKLTLIGLLPLTIAVSACSSDDADVIDSDEAPLCVEDDFMSPPFAGPKFDIEGGLIGEAQEQYVASTTYIVLRPDEASLERFYELNEPIATDLATREGLVGYTIGLSAKCNTGRTVAVWESEEAMYNFVVDKAHAAAMAEFTDIATGGVTTHWTIDGDNVPPTWEEAKGVAAEAQQAY